MAQAGALSAAAPDNKQPATPLPLSAQTRAKLQAMWDASWESVRWRQDRHKTGGIVESDERVNKLYWPWCWPRNFIVEPMLAVKYYDRV